MIITKTSSSKNHTAGGDLLEVALFYRSLGWSVLALCPPDHAGMGDKHTEHCESPGKRPWHSWTEHQSRSATEQEIRGWWNAHPNSNVGVALGAVSGLVRVDVEGELGEAALQQKSAGDLHRLWSSQVVGAGDCCTPYPMECS